MPKGFELPKTPPTFKGPDANTPASTKKPASKAVKNQPPTPDANAGKAPEKDKSKPKKTAGKVAGAGRAPKAATALKGAPASAPSTTLEKQKSKPEAVKKEAPKKEIEREQSPEEKKALAFSKYFREGKTTRGYALLEKINGMPHSEELLEVMPFAELEKFSADLFLKVVYFFRDFEEAKDQNKSSGELLKLSSEFITRENIPSGCQGIVHDIVQNDIIAKLKADLLSKNRPASAPTATASPAPAPAPALASAVPAPEVAPLSAPSTTTAEATLPPAPASAPAPEPAPTSAEAVPPRPRNKLFEFLKPRSFGASRTPERAPAPTPASAETVPSAGTTPPAKPKNPLESLLTPKKAPVPSTEKPTTSGSAPETKLSAEDGRSPESITIEALRTLIKENPEKMAATARAMFPKTSETTTPVEISASTETPKPAETTTDLSPERLSGLTFDTLAKLSPELLAKGVADVDVKLLAVALQGPDASSLQDALGTAFKVSKNTAKADALAMELWGPLVPSGEEIASARGKVIEAMRKALGAKSVEKAETRTEAETPPPPPSAPIPPEKGENLEEKWSRERKEASAAFEQLITSLSEQDLVLVAKEGNPINLGMAMHGIDKRRAQTVRENTSVVGQFDREYSKEPLQDEIDGAREFALKDARRTLAGKAGQHEVSKEPPKKPETPDASGEAKGNEAISTAEKPSVALCEELKELSLYDFTGSLEFSEALGDITSSHIEMSDEERKAYFAKKVQEHTEVLKRELPKATAYFKTASEGVTKLLSMLVKEGTLSEGDEKRYARFASLAEKLATQTQEPSVDLLKFAHGVDAFSWFTFSITQQGDGPVAIQGQWFQTAEQKLTESGIEV